MAKGIYRRFIFILWGFSGFIGVLRSQSEGDLSALFFQGKEKFMGKDYIGAEAVFSRLLMEEKDIYSAACYYRALSVYYQGRYASSAAYFMDCLSSGRSAVVPSHFRSFVLYMRGLSLWHLGDWGGCYSQMREIGEGPLFLEAYGVRGQVLDVLEGQKEGWKAALSLWAADRADSLLVVSLQQMLSYALQGRRALHLFIEEENLSLEEEKALRFFFEGYHSVIEEEGVEVGSFSSGAFASDFAIAVVIGQRRGQFCESVVSRDASWAGGL